ncbi:ABC transporter ATP-binding protein [Pseudonocardia abyssalis]|uniref:ATP-binding cassette domain-containing protein n=1 Tax=Pseudonocardia abyssalis TaxID=2792008 RepID=A0ABS6URC8_9PSEU|nr:ATP-binding cassette domain-containing protein [Pseudonocardia abyssalis]MBW0113736.1 ATP-binding cassette domain-containing protein [Pseudonocardia abyssalis]MBW0134809.1 ATP-binding cassette domain-containing protein [Pseudonocardia abyssalis]
MTGSNPAAGSEPGEARAGARGAPPAIRIDGVTTVRGDTVVLHRLGLEVPAGRVTVLMGPSGAGKTTLIRHLVGLIPPDAGSIEIGGHQVVGCAAADLRDLRRGIGALLGGSTVYEGSTFGSLTVYDNVAFPLRQIPGADEELVRPRVTWWLRTLGLQDVADRLPSELAAHMRRRVGLAAALVTDPPLVLLDDLEPAFDSLHEEQIIATIRATQRRTGATMLITTHDLRVARELGDGLAVLCNARIVATGDPAVLLDGVHDGAEFDRRFRILDQLGPPDLDAALRAARERRMRTVDVDPAFVICFLLLIAVVYLAMMQRGL